MAAAVAAVGSDEMLASSVVLGGGGVIRLRYGPQGARLANDLDWLVLGCEGGRFAEGEAERMNAEVRVALERGLARVFRPFERWRADLQRAVKVEVRPAYAPTPWSEVELVVAGEGVRVKVASGEYLLGEKITTIFLTLRHDPPRCRDLWDVAFLARLLRDPPPGVRPLDAGGVRRCAVETLAFNLYRPPDAVLDPRLLTDAMRHRFGRSYREQMRGYADAISFEAAWPALLALLREIGL